MLPQNLRALWAGSFRLVGYTSEIVSPTPFGAAWSRVACFVAPIVLQVVGGAARLVAREPENFPPTRGVDSHTIVQNCIVGEGPRQASSIPDEV